MTQAQLFKAMEAGIKAAEKAATANSDLFIGGDIAAGNDISALAMIALLSGQNVTSVISPPQERLRHSDKKLAQRLDEAMLKHAKSIQSPLQIVQYFGGFETAALCGAFLRCAQLGLHIIMDGLMASMPK